MTRVEEVGIQTNIGKGFLIGILFALGFIILNKISPNFALGLPSLPLALSDYFKALVIIFLAPVFEEIMFRKVLVERLMLQFKRPFWRANLEQAFWFSLFHLVAYGVVLGTLKKLSELFGVFASVSGMFFTAFLFGLLMGWIVKKYKNVLITMVTHAGVNGYLFSTLFAVLMIG